MFKKVPAFITACLLLVFYAFADASTPKVTISAKPQWLLTSKPYDKKLPARQIDGGYYYQLIEEQFNVEKEADYNHNIREIVSEAGVQNASEISVGFDPSFEKLDFHQLVIWRDGKPQDRLREAKFKIIADEKELSKFIYQGTYSAYLILDDIRKGDRIEYAYTITGRNPIFKNKFFKDIYFDGSSAIAHEYITILSPQSRKLNVKGFNKQLPLKQFNNGPLHYYEWEGFQVQPVISYNDTPGWYNPYGRVQISEYNNWKEVTDWALGINKVPEHLSGDLAAKVAQLKKQTGYDKEEYFRKAVMLVQDEVRYMGVEMGQYSHQANAPEKVFKQRYGDCKDKALLLAAILRANDIEAYMVLVNSDVRKEIDQYIPTPNAFDHAVAVAMVNGKQVWVDATIAYQRGTGTNIYFPHYGKGLVLKAGNQSLTDLPDLKGGTTSYEEIYTVPDEKGKVQLDVRSVYTSYHADNMRNKLASESRDETEKNYLKYYNKIYKDIEAKDSLTVIDNPAANQLTTIEHYEISNFFTRDSTERGRYQASFYANMVDNQLLNVATDARAPISINYPYHLNYTIKVVLPGWNIGEKENSLSNKYFSFNSHQWAKGDTLYLNYKYAAKKDFLPVADFDSYKKDVKQVENDYLSYTFNYTPDVSTISFKMNWWMLAFTLLIAAIAAFAGYKIYTRETPGIMFTYGSNFKMLGGWLILVTIGMALTVLLVLSTLITNGPFDVHTWNSHLSSGFGFRFMILFTAFGNTVELCYAIFCFILLVNRRDILPKAIIGFYTYCAVFIIANYTLSANLLSNGKFGADAGAAIIRSVLTAAIWIPYFMRSVRVEETFIVPYPPTNFSYETVPVPIQEGNDGQAEN
ncbi:DUF3857 domain-containing protein [Mucilaginibacter sp. RS28]|uniref:DUF3857 domain-containing protein n=1 Tax=Mucilaginibacter straminoryzae TaxID=2932774 RepID=A0A9X1X9C6_9SPHI|nr:DUF3857 domain-containing protein [Mucilaginibacter straminoryzae]MCJ8210799.1 DUF3857 domain-containing protein [Mucilaginibacter straminoryzae]